MSEEETKVAAGIAGFWAGILLGLGLFGFPVRASDLPPRSCVERRSVEHATGTLPGISLSEACDAAESR